VIRVLTDADTSTIYDIINVAAIAYKGVIPEDCWHEPYMPRAELQGELDAGVVFSGYESEGWVVGVMGRQDRGEVILLRHAYVLPEYQGQGIGGRLLQHLIEDAARPVLVGTWAAASWALGFYEKHGYRLVTPTAEKDRLLRTYWTISDRQVETSVVLGDERWFTAASPTP